MKKIFLLIIILSTIALTGCSLGYNIFMGFYIDGLASSTPCDQYTVPQGEANPEKEHCINSHIQQCTQMKVEYGRGFYQLEGTPDSCTMTIRGWSTKIAWWIKKSGEYVTIKGDDKPRGVKATCSGPIEYFAEAPKKLLSEISFYDSSTEEYFDQLKQYCTGGLLDVQYDNLMSYEPERAFKKVLENITQQALDKKDIQLCANAMRSHDVQSCFDQYLTTHPEDIEICNLFKDKKFDDQIYGYQHSLEDLCIGRFSSICSLLKSPQDCYYKLALKRKAVDSCRKTGELESRCREDVRNLYK